MEGHLQQGLYRTRVLHAILLNELFHQVFVADIAPWNEA